MTSGTDLTTEILSLYASFYFSTLRGLGTDRISCCFNCPYCIMFESSMFFWNNLLIIIKNSLQNTFIMVIADYVPQSNRPYLTSTTLYLLNPWISVADVWTNLYAVRSEKLPLEEQVEVSLVVFGPSGVC